MNELSPSVPHCSDVTEQPIIGRRITARDKVLKGVLFDAIRVYSMFFEVLSFLAKRLVVQGELSFAALSTVALD